MDFTAGLSPCTWRNHSLPFADFRRLAAKKALASSKNPFSSFITPFSSSRENKVSTKFVLHHMRNM